MPNYNKLQRGICLGLFTVSSVASYFNPNMLQLVAFSLLGVIANDVICYLRDKDKPKDNKELLELKERFSKVEEEFKSIKGDISIAKIGATIRRG